MSDNNTAVSKKEIIESLMASGMTLDEAAAAYESAFAPQSGGVKLPFPLIKVNNDATVADMGALVADPIKNEDSGDTEGYNVVVKFEDADILILDRRAMYSCYDSNTGRTTVKTKLLDTYAKAAAYIDAISGEDIVSLRAVNEDIKYQQLVLVGVRAKGTNDAFVFYNMFAKGAILYNINQLLDTCTGSQYVVLNAITKTSKKGSVKYTEFKLDESSAMPLPSVEVLKNVIQFLDAKTQFNNYVTEYNGGLGTPEVPEAVTAGLPE